ncbi:peptidase inhibitor family I36 protein [Methylobacterium iners]|nr:peptidase inhibitor family I36 protein [Methylobacterium iners]
MAMGQGLDGTLNLPAVIDAPAEAPKGSSRWIVVPLLLAAGWGALLGYSAVFLTEDVPMRPATHQERAEAEPVPPPVLKFPPEPPRVIVAATPWRDPAASPVQAPAAEAAPVRRVASIGDEAIAPATTAAATVAPVAVAPPERSDYVGVWGPTGAACNAPSRRRGFLPATITETSAKAGRTLCTFRDGRRAGNAWTMAAECSERGRRWSSQVRLVVDGDRLTWSSGKGASTYVRCGRRDG